MPGQSFSHFLIATESPHTEAEYKFIAPETRNRRGGGGAINVAGAFDWLRPTGCWRGWTSSLIEKESYIFSCGEYDWWFQS